MGDGQRMMITYGKGEAMEGRRYLLEELSDGWMRHAMQEQRTGGTTILEKLSEGWDTVIGWKDQVISRRTMDLHTYIHKNGQQRKESRCRFKYASKYGTRSRANNYAHAPYLFQPELWKS